MYLFIHTYTYMRDGPITNNSRFLRPHSGLFPPCHLELCILDLLHNNPSWPAQRAECTSWFSVLLLALACVRVRAQPETWKYLRHSLFPNEIMPAVGIWGLRTTSRSLHCSRFPFWTRVPKQKRKQEAHSWASLFLNLGTACHWLVF